jgi:hypothetical protein
VFITGFFYLKKATRQQGIKATSKKKGKRHKERQRGMNAKAPIRPICI